MVKLDKVVPPLNQLSTTPRKVVVSGGIAPPFLTTALHGGKWSASSPGRFISEERAPGTHWIGGWVSPTAGVDTVERRKY
jgi:hypothetical protein